MPILLLLAACSGSSSKDSAAPGDTTDDSAAPTDDTDTPPGDTDAPPSGPAVDQAAVIAGVVDAAPLADPSTFVFIAKDGRVCSVPADGSAEPSCRSDLFQSGAAILASLDGENVYLAAEERGGEEPPFIVVAVAVGVGVAVAGAVALASSASHAVPEPVEIAYIPGTESHLVSALAVSGTADAELVWFTGYAPGADEMSLFRVPAAGGAPEEVASGFGVPLAGVTIAADGAAYVTGIDDAGGGQLFEVADGAVTAIASGFRAGNPAGVALTPDGGTVMISALSDEGTAEVVLVDRATRETAIFDDVISANHASGGLHASPGDPTVYAWADLSAGVYRVHF